MKTRWPWLALGIALLVAAVGFQALPFAQAAEDPVVREDHRARHERQPGDDLERLRQQPLRRARDRHQLVHRRHGLGRVAVQAVRPRRRNSRRSASCRSASTAARGSARCSSRPRRRCASARRASRPARRASSAARSSSSRPIRSRFPGRAQGGQPVPKENVEKKRAAVQAAIAGDQRQQGGLQGRLGADSRRQQRLRPRRPPRLEARRTASPEYLDAEMMPPLTKALVDAGALGTIQSATPPSPAQPDRNSEPPPSASSTASSRPGTRCRCCRTSSCSTRSTTRSRRSSRRTSRSSSSSTSATGSRWGRSSTTTSWPRSAARPTRTSTSSSAATSTRSPAAPAAWTTGRGSRPGWRRIRLIAAAGAKPKRSIVFIAFAAEEQGLVGSQAWLKKHPELHGKIVMMINRDGSPSAITGATVPETWYADFQAITAPLAKLNPKWPFTLARGVPRAHATSPGRHRLVVVRDAEHPDAQLRDDGREARAGREGDSLVHVFVRLAHAERPLQRTGALHRAPAALRARDGRRGVRRREPRQAAHARRRVPAGRALRHATIGSGDDARRS